jgi:hypothetical protein
VTSGIVTVCYGAQCDNQAIYSESSGLPDEPTIAQLDATIKKYLRV